jgi:hypothetical protein
MTAEFLTTRWNKIFSIVVLGVAVFFVIAVLTGMRVPFAEGGETGFYCPRLYRGFWLSSC